MRLVQWEAGTEGWRDLLASLEMQHRSVEDGHGRVGKDVQVVPKNAIVRAREM
jgi:hypothetical protein